MKKTTTKPKEEAATQERKESDKPESASPEFAARFLVTVTAKNREQADRMFKSKADKLERSWGVTAVHYLMADLNEDK